MKKLNRFVKRVLKTLGFILVEHYLYWEEYVSNADRSTLTKKARVITEIEIFRKGTPAKVIEAYNQAFARQKFFVHKLYYKANSNWTWRLIE